TQKKLSPESASKMGERASIEVTAGSTASRRSDLDTAPCAPDQVGCCSSLSRSRDWRNAASQRRKPAGLWDAALAELNLLAGIDPILNDMIRLGSPLTRKVYVEANWPGL